MGTKPPKTYGNVQISAICAFIALAIFPVMLRFTWLDRASWIDIVCQFCSACQGAIMYAWWRRPSETTTEPKNRDEDTRLE